VVEPPLTAPDAARWWRRDAALIMPAPLVRIAMRALLLPVLFAALAVRAQVPPPPEPPESVSPAASPAVPLEEIQRFVEVFRTVQRGYVEPLSDQALMEQGIRGLLLQLDAHSEYLSAEEAQAFAEEVAGRYDGIGVEVEQRPDGGLKIVAAIDGTPAARAGLRTGDVIVAVDGRSLAADGRPGSRVLRGAAGTRIVLTVLRPGEALPRDIAVVRDRVDVRSVRSRWLEPGYAYVRISHFDGETATALERQLRALQAEAALAGLVLDLRGNPGGLLNAAVESADGFLDGGLIASTRGRLPQANAVYRAGPGDWIGGAPLVVLLDAGTASSAEVLAGALRDQRRGLLLGARSFGKGTVQTVIPLANGDELKLTTARYYTPSGRSIQAVGITPDVQLPGTAIRGLREQDLPQHLRGDAEQADGYATGVIVEGELAVQEALRRVKQAAQVRRADRRATRG
jgi:carboxyl-terminal processing protease